MSRVVLSSGAGWRNLWSGHTYPHTLRAGNDDLCPYHCSRVKEGQKEGDPPANLNPSSFQEKKGISGQIPIPPHDMGKRFHTLVSGPALPPNSSLILTCELISDTFWSLRGILASARPPPPQLHKFKLGERDGERTGAGS